MINYRNADWERATLRESPPLRADQAEWRESTLDRAERVFAVVGWIAFPLLILTIYFY